VTTPHGPAFESLGAELRRAAREAPDRPFIRMMQGEWTYRAIDEEADRLAAGLQRLGVARGDHVSLLLPNCIAFIALWFALARLGAIAAPVNTSLRGALLADAIDLVRSRLVIVHADLMPQFAEVSEDLEHVAQVVRLGDSSVRCARPALPFAQLRAAAPVAVDPQPPIRASDLCLLLYTSGTTGRSKAAMISHRFVLAHAQLAIEGLGLRNDDVLYCPYPLFHLDATVMTVVPALLRRAVAAIGRRFSASRYWDEVRALRATVFDFMGATLTLLWKQPPSPRDRDHRARLGWGVPLPAWAPQFEARFGCRLVELYGLTEAGAMIYTPLDAPRRAGSCGKPIGPFDVSLQDEDGFEVPVGTPGELCLRPRAPGLVMDGYYRMPEESLAAFRNLWFHTGDLLKRDADGYFYFIGRRKDMVRRRGENIAAAEVERAIESHPDVLACAVYGVPSELSEEDVMAAVVPRAGAQFTAAQLIEFCEDKLARFMLPRYVRFLTALPKTPTDKVEKFVLKHQGVTADTWDREDCAP
jgi:crotonobetaine/carnitine-CoA ligase